MVLDLHPAHPAPDGPATGHCPSSKVTAAVVARDGRDVLGRRALHMTIGVADIDCVCVDVYKRGRVSKLA